MGFESEVDVGSEVVGRRCLGHGVGLVERHHRRPAEAQFTGQRPGQGTETAVLADHDPALCNRTEAGAEPLSLTYGGNPRPRTRLGAHDRQRSDRVGAADAIRWGTAIRLELLQPVRCWDRVFRRRDRSRSRFARSRDSSATSSPRRLGEVRTAAGRRASNRVSTSAVQVCSSQMPSHCRPRRSGRHARPRWQDKDAASAPAAGANPAAPRGAL